MRQSLDQQHVLIAGGSGELGFAAARALVDAGAPVTLLARGSEALTTAATRLINDVDGDVLTVTADLANRPSVSRAVDHAVASFGDIQTVIYALRHDVTGPYDQLDPAVFQQALTTMVAGALNLAAATIPAMQARGQGRVLFMMGQDAVAGRRFGAADCAIMHGLNGMIRALAREVADTGVIVNGLVCGLVDSDRLALEVDQVIAHTRRDRNTVMAELSLRNPQRRLIELAEIGDLACWLVDPQNKAINGQIIAADGGEVGSPL
ncbi:MAG: SDR family oxidoreductase [Pseudomonadota bacterium]